LSVFRPKAEF